MQNRADHFFNEGAAFAKLGQHEEAITSYAKALAVNPDYDEARENREVALRQQDKKS